MILAEISQKVRERLQGHPAAFKVPALNLDMFVVRDFLDERECQELITRIDANRVPSRLLAPTADPEFRTSESCNFNRDDPVIAAIETKINALTGIEPSHGEVMQGQRYAVGQQFKQHHDFFYTDQPYWQQQKHLGGQRTWTAMIFLNKPEAGGQTYFEKAGVKITPRTGNLLAWNNMDASGAPNLYSLHQGLPVEAGVKYVITKWYRERPWIAAPLAG